MSDRIIRTSVAVECIDQRSLVKQTQKRKRPNYYQMNIGDLLRFIAVFDRITSL